MGLPSGAAAATISAQSALSHRPVLLAATPTRPAALAWCQSAATHPSLYSASTLSTGQGSIPGRFLLQYHQCSSLLISSNPRTHTHQDFTCSGMIMTSCLLVNKCFERAFCRRLVCPCSAPRLFPRDLAFQTVQCRHQPCCSLSPFR